MVYRFEGDRKFKKSVFLKACEMGDYETIEKELKKGANPNAIDYYNSGLSMLHIAITSGNPFAVELLIKKGAKVNFQASRLKMTPIHCAAYLNHQQIVDILLKHGADINIKNSNGLTPLDIALIENNNFDSVAILVGKGAKISQKNIQQIRRTAIEAIIQDKVEFIDYIRSKRIKNPETNYMDYLLRRDIIGESSYGIDNLARIALANLSINSIKKLACHRNKIQLYPNSTFALNGKENLFHVLARQLPQTKLFLIAKKFLHKEFNIKRAEDKLTVKHSISKFLDTDLKFVNGWESGYSYKHKRLYLKSINYLGARYYFDENGNILNLVQKIKKLSDTITLLIKNGNDINAKNFKNSTPLAYMLDCPSFIIKKFIDAGMKVDNESLFQARKNSNPSVIKLLEKNCKDLNQLSQANKKSLGIL